MFLKSKLTDREVCRWSHRERMGCADRREAYGHQWGSCHMPARLYVSVERKKQGREGEGERGREGKKDGGKERGKERGKKEEILSVLYKW